MKNLMEKKSTKIIVFILLLALFDFNNIALFVIGLFIYSSMSENFNFWDGILIDEHCIIF